MSDETRRLQAYDWLEDLREFPPQVVEGACQRWRRQLGGKRPTPGDIRQMCFDEQRDYPSYYGLDDDSRLTGPDSHLAPDERYARSAGWSSAAERRDAIAANEDRIERGLAWQREHAAELKQAVGFKSLGAALGVTVREYKPTAEQLRLGREQLGLRDYTEPMP